MVAHVTSFFQNLYTCCKDFLFKRTVKQDIYLHVPMTAIDGISIDQDVYKRQSLITPVIVLRLAFLSIGNMST